MMLKQKQLTHWISKYMYNEMLLQFRVFGSC